jgi:hypothetical protein
MRKSIKELNSSEWSDTVSTKDASTIDMSEWETEEVSPSLSKKILGSLKEYPKKLLESTIDARVGAAQGVLGNLADELFGIGSTAAKKVMGDETPVMDLYKQERQVARNVVTQSKERSPYIEAAGEVIGSQLNPVTKAGGFVKNLASGALQGAGMAQEMEDIPKEAGIGAALAGAGDMIVGAAKIPFKNPDIMRAKSVLGFGPMSKSQASKIVKGSNLDKKQVAKDLNDLNFFSYRDVKFDPKARKFVPIPDKHSLYKIRVPTRDMLVERAQPAIDLLNTQNKALLQRKNVVFSPDEVKEKIASLLNDVSKTYKKDTTKVGSVNNAVEKIKADLFETIDTAETAEGMKLASMDLSHLEDLKLKLWKEAKNIIGKDATDPVVNMEKQLREDMAAKLANTLEETIGKEYGANNKIQSRLITAIDDMQAMEMVDEVGGFQNPLPIGTGPMYAAGKATEVIGGGYPGSMIRSSVGETMSNMPGSNYLEQFLKQAPQKGIQGQVSPQDKLMYQESVIRTPIPRDVDRILQNKPFILEKIKLQMPEVYPSALEIFKNQPDMVEDFVKGAVMMFPTMFEKDKYNRINGKIAEPQMKQLAIEDTRKNPNLSNTEKIASINRLNQTGEFNG